MFSSDTSVHHCPAVSTISERAWCAAPRVTPASQVVDTGGHWWTLVALLDNCVSLTH